MIPQREGRRILMPPRTSSGASNAVIDLTQTSPNPNAAHPSNEDEREQQEEHEDDYDEQQEFIHEHPNGSDNDSDVDMNNRHVYHDMNPFLHSSDSEDRHLDSGEDVHSDSDARGSSDARESDGDGSSDGVEVISSNERANRTRSRLSSDSDEFVSHTRALRSRHRDVYADAESGRARNQLVLQRLRQRHLQHPSLGSEQDDEDPDAALARRLQEEEYSGVQSSNVEDNVQRLLGILESENVDDDNEENEDDHDDEGGEETELDQDCIPRGSFIYSLLFCCGVFQTDRFFPLYFFNFPHLCSRQQTTLLMMRSMITGQSIERDIHYCWTHQGQAAVAHQLGKELVAGVAAHHVLPVQMMMSLTRYMISLSGWSGVGAALVGGEGEGEGEAEAHQIF
ncbi:hypothetical protein BJ741DRAFT_429266 [Chytriomyces cf. hyalinus JEL632]|nr:hypothetical protein BJ741DRAFT_429266 [Chytriomyces cf. hyalinus JEL632]